MNFACYLIGYPITLKSFMKKKKNFHKKSKPKRNKQYKGAAAQSARDKEQINVSYDNAIDYISNYSNKINSINSSLSFLDKIQYQNSIFSAIDGFQNQFSDFNKFETMLPRTDYLTGLGAMADITRSSTIGLSSLNNIDSISKITDVWTANFDLEKQNRIFNSSLYSNSYFKGLEIPDLTGAIKNYAKTNELFSYGIQSSLIKATELNLFAEKSLSKFSWETVGDRIKIGAVEKTYIQNSFLDFSTDFSTLLKTYNPNKGSIITTNPELIKLPSVEYFTSSNLIEAITTEEDVSTEEEIVKTDIQYENEYSLMQWLPKIDEGLIKMWKGAIEALNSNNSDRIRHFVTSIRELYTHLFHILAPDQEIVNWSKSADDFANGRPTRKARLSFICRNISDEPFKKFVNKDIEATLAFIDLFQKGTHSIDPIFTTNHLITIKCKAETTLRFLLEIHFTTNN